MADKAPGCAIIIPVTIGRRESSVSERTPTGEFAFDSGVYRYIDQSATVSEDCYETLESWELPTTEIPTEDLGLDEKDARQVDEFVRGLEDSSATLAEETAPEWFKRD